MSHILQTPITEKQRKTQVYAKEKYKRSRPAAHLQEGPTKPDQMGVQRYELPNINTRAQVSELVEGRAGEVPPRGRSTPRVGRTQTTSRPGSFQRGVPLLFLKAVAKVSIHKDGENWPWRL